MPACEGRTMTEFFLKRTSKGDSMAGTLVPNKTRQDVALPAKIDDPCHYKELGSDWSSSKSTSNHFKKWSGVEGKDALIKKDINEKSRSPKRPEIESRKKGFSKSENRELISPRSSSSRDANVNTETDRWSSSLEQTCPVAWKHKREHDNVKGESGGWNRHKKDDNAFESDSGAWKQENGDGNVKRQTVASGTAPNQAGHDAWELQSRDSNANREIDGWGTWGKAPDQAGPNPLKWHRSDDNVKNETDRWDKAPGKTSHDPWKPQSRDVNLNRETKGCGSEWSKALDRSVPNACKRHSRDNNVNKESDRWGTTFEQISGHGSRNCQKDGNVKKEADGVGAAHNRTSRDAGNCDGRVGNVKKETDGWVKALDQTGPDPWKQHIEDGNADRRTDGWGSAVEQIGADPQKHHIRDGDSAKETDVWDAAVKQAGYHSIHKESDGWGAALDQRAPDAWNRPARDGGVKRETARWGTSLDQRGPDAWKQHRRDGTDGWVKPFDQTGHDNRSHRSRSRSPPFGVKHGTESRDNRGGIGAGRPARACKDFAAGRCRFGSRCRFAHDDNGPSHGDGGATEIRESRLETVRDSGPGICYQFAQGRCYRGDECKFVPDDPAANGGLLTKDDSKERVLDRTDAHASLGPWLEPRSSIGCEEPKLPHPGEPGGRSECRGHDARWSNNNNNNNNNNKVTDNSSAWDGWGDQTTKMKSSNSSQWVNENSARVAATHSTDMVDPGCTRVPAPAVAPSFQTTMKGLTRLSASGPQDQHPIKNSDVSSAWDGWGDQTTKMNPSNSSQWVNENASRVASDPSCARPSAAPSIQTTVKGLTRFSASSGPQDRHPIKNSDLKEKHDHGTGKPSQAELGGAKGANGSETVRTEDGNSRIHDQSARKFKFALVEFVKGILKPSWQKGHLSKEAHVSIVKKVVDKVIGVLRGPNIPQTQEQIDLYLSFSRTKLNNLVQAYLEMHVVRTEHMGEKV